MRLAFNSASVKQDYLGSGLIFLNVILLSIWAIKDTIALRNIVLVLGAIASIIYIANDWRFGNLKKQLRSVHTLPLILAGLLFAWVFIHFFCFSQDPISQLQELKSTWLRVLLGSILAWGTGLVILRKRMCINYLWLGILLGILAVYTQYIPKALAKNALFVPDYHGYLFEGKINGVLVGTLLIAGLTGTALDLYRQHQLSTHKWVMAFWLLGVVVVMYSYVFIYDTRNGFGLAAILFAAIILSGMLWVIKRIITKGATKELAFMIMFIVGLAILASIFTYHQIQRNTGWLTLVEDAKIAVQVDKYPQWQRSNIGGEVPQTESGRVVVGNTYERVAWAVVGVRLIGQHPLGTGVLYTPFNKLLQIDYPGATPYATHSGWIDLTLSLGIPALLLMWGILASVFYLGAKSDGSFAITVPIMAGMIFLLYLVGELNGKHAVEILFYWFAILTALQLPQISKTNHSSIHHTV
ncbi:hypothetical protein ICN19_03080 [Polynucleobacter sp. AP-Capit-er-40B-B4]|uniref:hypothetical protein n=1 Tax=Polynucleobacter sp. AP-Capit-er-40B-B4 TaxID=2576927 RepID=UPI001C0D0388|nr:hypothetical protein [Polynucleobacter sp. AP-Capit-er-40B-B4]MBU3580997.1 hypothetical protein [Polynucleobacter sp. AP-Capit-er-40B-B4]